MAGLGKKTFVAGEVLLAQDVNGYLMDQSVMVFGGTAARSSAIPTPTEGMMSYRTDDNVVEVFDGSAYVGVGGSDSGLIHIKTETFSAVASQSVDNVFSANFDNYKILLNNVTTSALAAFNLRLRASGTDTSTNYNRQRLLVTSTTVAGARTTSNTSMDAVARSQIGIPVVTEIFMSGPFIANQTYASVRDSEGEYGTSVSMFFANYNQTASTSFDGFTLLCSTGNMSGSISVYGYRK